MATSKNVELEVWGGAESKRYIIISVGEKFNFHFIAALLSSPKPSDKNNNLNKINTSS